MLLSRNMSVSWDTAQGEKRRFYGHNCNFGRGGRTGQHARDAELAGIFCRWAQPTPPQQWPAKGRKILQCTMAGCDSTASCLGAEAGEVFQGSARRLFDAEAPRIPSTRFDSRRCTGICGRVPLLPLFTGILPTTDAVIVLTQLAKDPGADRSVSEISVLPQHFKMDNLLIGLSFPESRARESSC